MDAARGPKTRKQKTYGKSAAKKVFSAAFHKLSPDNGFPKKQMAIPTKTTSDTPRIPLTLLSTNLSEPSSPSSAFGHLSGEFPGPSTKPVWRNTSPAGHNKSHRQLVAQRSNNDASIGEPNVRPSKLSPGVGCQNQGPSKARQLAEQRRKESARTDIFSDNLPNPSIEPIWRRMGPVGYSKSCHQLTTQKLKDGVRVDELSDGLLKLSTNMVYGFQRLDATHSSQCQLSAPGIGEQDNTANPKLVKGSGCLAKDIEKIDKKPASKKISARNTEFGVYENQLAKLCSLSINPSGPLEFQAWANKAAQKLTVLKIAEASYGEVYRLQPKDGMETEAKDCHSVVKVIAIQPFRMPKNSKLRKSQMSPINEIISEVEIMDRMTDIPGFVIFKGLHVVQGRLAKQYVDAWMIYHNIDPSRSLFPNPNNKSTYQSDQLWAVIEMEDAGDELSDVPVGNFIQAWDIFWGVTLALAKGEDMAKFEHRDLHVGNICVTRSNLRPEENFASISTLSSEKFGLSGLTTTIIDYTLSRADMNEPYISDEENQSRVVFTDLDRDKALFEAEGDYQYDIYRMMRSSIYYAYYPNAFNIWQNYHPQTNVYWLHHLAVVLLKKIDISRNDKTASGQDGTIKNFDMDGAFRGNFLELEHLINPKRGEKFTTAREIVAWALDNEWLQPADIDNVV